MRILSPKLVALALPSRPATGSLLSDGINGKVYTVSQTLGYAPHFRFRPHQTHKPRFIWVGSYSYSIIIYRKVFLGAKKKDKNHLYAIKIMSKTAMKKKNLVSQGKIFKPSLIPLQVTTERNALAIMEYLIGGDLKSLIMAAGYLEEQHAAFYMAEMAIAVKYLHEHGIIHRDLKPDNILITAKGHLKLTDFGLSQFNWQRALQPADVLDTPSISRSQGAFLRTPGQVISLTSAISFQENNPVKDEPVENPDDLLTSLNKCNFSKDAHFSPQPNNDSETSKEPKLIITPPTPLSKIERRRDVSPSLQYLRSNEDRTISSYPGPPTSILSSLCSVVSTLSFTHRRSPFRSPSQPVYMPPDSTISKRVSWVNANADYEETCFKQPRPPPARAIVQTPGFKLFCPIAQRKRLTSADFSNALCLSIVDPKNSTFFLNGQSPLKEQNEQILASISKRHASKASHLKTPDDLKFALQPLDLGDDIEHINGTLINTPAKLFQNSSTSNTNITPILSAARYADIIITDTGSPPTDSPVRNEFPNYQPRSALRSIPRILGTPEYLAPEMLNLLEYKTVAQNSPAIDWWALGVILYEMLTGIPPFTDDSPEAVFERILNLDIKWPKFEVTDEESGQPKLKDAILPDARHLIAGLLSRLPDDRLNVALTIDRHPFFGQVGPWSELQSVHMPFVPCPDNETDTCYFELRNTAKSYHVTYSGSDL